MAVRGASLLARLGDARVACITPSGPLLAEQYAVGAILTGLALIPALPVSIPAALITATA